MPAVYDLANRGLLPPGFSLVGFARRDWEDQDFAEVVHDAVKEHARTPFREEVWQQLSEGMRFIPGDFDDDDAFEQLRKAVDELDASRGTGGNYAFYLSVPPKFFPKVVQQLKKHGLADAPEGSWRRAVIEKPFGHDLESARELNALVHEVFEPDQVFRIDHYLGKETVQNILALRFANQMYEPIWNRSYVDHVQITMAEDIGIGGRAGYYDGIGAARDVIQNHLLQLMALTAMEEPASFDADVAAHREAEGPEGGTAAGGPGRAHRARPVRGAAGRAASRCAATSRRTASTRPPRPTPTRHQAGASTTAAGRACRSTCVPASGWAAASPRSRSSSSGPRTPRSTPPRRRSWAQNAIVIRVQPDEGMTVRFGSKVPGTSMEIRDVSMDFAYGESFTESSPEAYERLILDVLLGDANLFPRHQEVEESWKILDPIEQYWDEHGRPAQYASGSWGPEEADEMLARDGRSWRRP